MHGHGGSVFIGQIAVQEDDIAMHGSDGLRVYGDDRTSRAERYVGLRQPNEVGAPAGSTPLGADIRPGAGSPQYSDLTPELRLIATAKGGDIDGAAQIEDLQKCFTLKPLLRCLLRQTT